MGCSIQSLVSFAFRPRYEELDIVSCRVVIGMSCSDHSGMAKLAPFGLSSMVRTSQRPNRYQFVHTCTTLSSHVEAAMSSALLRCAGPGLGVGVDDVSFHVFPLLFLPVPV